MDKWYPLIIYLLVQCITPGPHNLTCLYLGGKYGLKGTMPFLTSSICMVLLKAFACGLLNIFLARVMPAVSEWIKWIGAAYMLYLAWVMMRSGWREGAKGISIESVQAGWRSGVMLQIFSGKSWIMCLSMFAIYVMPVSSGAGAVLFACVLLAAISLVCSMIWILCGSGLRPLIERYRKPFGIIMGLSLIYCAVKALLP